MHLTRSSALAVVVAAATAPRLHAQPAPATAAPAIGPALQVQIPGAGAFSMATVTSSGLLVGYQLSRALVGVQLGLVNLQIIDGGDPRSDRDGETVSASLVTVTPAVAYDVWISADGRARLDVIAAIGLGRASLARVRRYDDGASVFESTEEHRAWVVPARFGVGGDWFLHPSFALGLETGVQGLFGFGVETDDGTTSSSRTDTADVLGLYSALRATFVLGD